MVTTSRATLSPADRQCDHCRGLGFRGNLSCDYCYNGVACCACRSSAVLPPDADGEVRCGACSRKFDESFCACCGVGPVVAVVDGVGIGECCLRPGLVPATADDHGVRAAS